MQQLAVTYRLTGRLGFDIIRIATQCRVWVETAGKFRDLAFSKKTKVKRVPRINDFPILKFVHPQFDN